MKQLITTEEGAADNVGAKRIRQNAWESALQATFGMWADRNDITGDGVAYVQEIRRGHRLENLRKSYKP